MRDKLFPGFRDRLLETIQLLEPVRSLDFDDELYVDYLAFITGTVPQTARRWVDKQDPGLPDLVSLATLCHVVGIDVNWMLGLTAVRLPSVQGDDDWLQELVCDIGRAGENLVGMRVEDDGMAPAIRRGDWVLIDPNERAWGHDGMYALQFKVAAGEPAGLDTAKPSLLFVDDERSILTALRAVFRRGYRVSTTTDADEAIRLIKQQRIDVLVCDQRMPQMAGTQLMEAAAAVSPSTVRILMTDYADQSTILDALNEVTAHRIVLKPWNDERIRQVVNESILLAKTLRRESAEAAQDRNDDGGCKVVELPLRQRAVSAAVDPAADGPAAVYLDGPHDQVGLRNIATRPDGGFTVFSNDRCGETVVTDESHAKALGIHVLGRVRLKISLTPT